MAQGLRFSRLGVRGFWVVTVVCGALLTALAPTAHAAMVTRGEFSPAASEFDFTGYATGTAIVVSPDLTVTGGEVYPINTGSIVSPAYTNLTSGSDFRVDFTGLVSAIGMDTHLNGTAVVMDLYSSSDMLLESNRWEYADLAPTPSFIGLDFGAANVSYALIRTPDQTGHDIYIDNLIYEVGVIPEPGTLALFGLGVFGVAAGVVRRRRR